ncbi:uncharacterized protein LOC114249207 [Bombyx mandarina]|uniref:Uncharacterized protein LOC114249207 n=1 Tax=Bombyx mandarina TaxID=7092 RepID=A0A6J2KDZ9_BOMMA|nr:uncharacterized protein LOC114249207 [Bombyx mandarina]XP_028038485.1 uncharacterized protein LOC114249207 [Bombyx mandarina]
MQYLVQLMVAFLLTTQASSDNSTLSEDTCITEHGLWGSLLEKWAVSATPQHTRQGRIMALPPAHGYYVSDRIDLMPPPPPPPRLYPTTQHLPHPSHYNEWQASPPPPPGPGKIVNRPPNPYKDKFKPSYPPPSPNQPIPVHTPQQPYAPGGLVDRVDETKPSKPQKQVSETDLYLLTAIEKLVYRVDLMEKRLRKMEENVHFVLAGTDVKPEPCASNFTRVGSGCYYFSTDAINWKNANYACRKLKGNLLELDADDEKRHLFANLLSDSRLKGADYWTGGLNPGLLWIWSHSAKPVSSNNTNTSSSHSIAGEGRCLALVHDPALHSYLYRGQDCALRHRYVCEKEEDNDKLGNEIERVAKKLREVKRKSRILISGEDP